MTEQKVKKEEAQNINSEISCDLDTKRDFLESVDLLEVNLHVPIHVYYWKILCFAYDALCFQYKTLFFVLKLMPSMFIW